MDELIYKFIKTYLAIELQELILESYTLFEKFDYKDVDDSLINILTSEDFTDPGELQDIFLTEFNNKIDYVINQNGIKLKQETTINDKVEIMKSLYQLQHLENYNILYNLITSDNDDETKFSLILAENCCLDVAGIMYLIESIDNDIVKMLQQFIEMKLNKDSTDICADDVMTNIKQFFTYLRSKKQSCLGTDLINSRTILGLEFSYYFPFIEDDILAISDEQTALNFLSVIMISKDGQNKVLEIFREYITKILDSVNHIQKIEKLLISHYESFNKFKQQVNDKK